MSGQLEDSRYVKLIPLNVGYVENPSDMLVEKSDTYGSLELKIADLYTQIRRENTYLKILEERFGPWPCWRYPDGNTQIPRTVKSLYLVDSKKEFLISMLRTEQDDVPLLVELPTSHTADTFLTRETLETAVINAGFKLKSAKIHGTSEDIEDQPYRIVDFRGLPTFPTVFSIICTHSNLAFRFKTATAFDKPIEPPYQTIINQCRRLVESALTPPIFPLKFIHISRVLLHLATSTADSDQEQTKDLRRLYKVQRIIDKFDEMMDQLASTEKDNATPREVNHRLDQVFFSCCKMYPGSVVVRQSYFAYQKLSLSDLGDLREQGYDTDWDPTESYDTLSDSSIESEFESPPQLLEQTLGPEKFGDALILASGSGTRAPLPGYERNTEHVEVERMNIDIQTVSGTNQFEAINPLQGHDIHGDRQTLDWIVSTIGAPSQRKFRLSEFRSNIITPSTLSSSSTPAGHMGPSSYLPTPIDFPTDHLPHISAATTTTSGGKAPLFEQTPSSPLVPAHSSHFLSTSTIPQWHPPTEELILSSSASAAMSAFPYSINSQSQQHQSSQLQPQPHHSGLASPSISPFEQSYLPAPAPGQAGSSLFQNPSNTSYLMLPPGLPLSLSPFSSSASTSSSSSTSAVTINADGAPVSGSPHAYLARNTTHLSPEHRELVEKKWSVWENDPIRQGREPISATLAIVGPLLATAKGALTMFEKQAMRERQEFDAVEDLRIAIDRLKSDASMYETLLSTMIAPEMDHQPAIDLCNSVKGNEALSELDVSLKAAKLLLEQNQMTSISKVPANTREKRETVVKRPPIRELIHSFLKANFTLEDETVHNMNDTTRDLDVCRKNCDRAFKLLWHLYVIYQQRPGLQRRASQESITIGSGELGRALNEVNAAFYQRPFSVSPEGEDRIRYGRLTTLNASHDASSQHQRLMKTLGETWVQERMEQKTSRDATGRAISRVQWLGGLQTTLFELLWSGTIEQLKRHSVDCFENPSLSSDPERKYLERELGELQKGLQEAIMRAKKQRFAIAFCGMVKAGKSLFLNALIGEPILPSDELPSTAWPCRLRHIPGQTTPELTYDDGPFKSGIQALQRAQYGRKLENYQPPSDDPFDSMFGEEPQEPTPEEVQLREIYVGWVDMHAATRRNLRDFEQKGFQLPKSARGHGPVKRLLGQLNDVVRLCHRFKLNFQMEDVEWPLLTVEFNSLRGVQMDGIYEFIDLPGIGEKFEFFDFETMIRLVAKDSNAIVPIISFKELDRSDWRKLPDIVASSFGGRASVVVCTHLDKMQGEDLTEQLASVSKVFWPRTGTDHSNIIACSSLMGLSARALLDMSRYGKPRFEDFWDDRRKRVEYPCAEKILGTGQPEDTFNRIGIQFWKTKLEAELVASGLPEAINKLTRELVDQAKQRAFLFESDSVRKQIRKMSQTQERKLLEARRTKEEFNDARKEYHMARGKFFELIDSWAVKELQQERSYLDRLDRGIKAMRTRADQSILDSIKKTMDEWNLGTLKQEHVDEDIGRGPESARAREKGGVTVLVVKSTSHAEEFLRISQRWLHTLLNKESQDYVSAVRKMAEDARGKRFNELKTEIAKLDPRIQPELREEIIEDLDNQSSDIRQVTFNHIKEAQFTTTSTNRSIQIKTTKTRYDASSAFRAIEEKIAKPLLSGGSGADVNSSDAAEESALQTIDELGFMLRAPVAALATIPFVFGLPIWPWMTKSKSFHIPMDVIENKYKEEIVEPWLKNLKNEGEKSLIGTIHASSAIAKAAVQNALQREDKRYMREGEQKEVAAKAGIVQHMVAMNSNLWAAESALILIQKMLRESLSGHTG